MRYKCKQSIHSVLSIRSTNTKASRYPLCVYREPLSLYGYCGSLDIGNTGGTISTNASIPVEGEGLGIGILGIKFVRKVNRQGGLGNGASTGTETETSMYLLSNMYFSVLNRN